MCAPPHPLRAGIVSVAVDAHEPGQGPASERPPAQVAVLERALGAGARGGSRTRYWHFCEALLSPEQVPCPLQLYKDWGPPPSSQSFCGSGDPLGGPGVAFSP